MKGITLPAILALSVVLNVFLLAKGFFVGIDSRGEDKDDGTLVAGVIDGDTIVLADNKTRVRLRYVDAPEKELCGSREANELLKSLTVGKKVRLSGIIPDQYGRGMALVYIGTNLINQQMVASGWVRYHSDETVEKEQIKKLSELAKENKLGVYGKCESMTPKNPKCAIKGNIDFPINKYTYHLPGCTQYETAIVQEDKGEAWFCTETEAIKAGFSKAKTCK